MGDLPRGDGGGATTGPRAHEIVRANNRCFLWQGVCVRAVYVLLK